MFSEEKPSLRSSPFVEKGLARVLCAGWFQCLHPRSEKPHGSVPSGHALPSPPSVVSAEQLVVRTRAFSFPRMLAFQFDITDQALRDSQVLDEQGHHSRPLEGKAVSHLSPACWPHSEYQVSITRHLQGERRGCSARHRLERHSLWKIIQPPETTADGHPSTGCACVNLLHPHSSPTGQHGRRPTLQTSNRHRHHLSVMPCLSMARQGLKPGTLALTFTLFNTCSKLCGSVHTDQGQLNTHHTVRVDIRKAVHVHMCVTRAGRKVKDRHHNAHNCLLYRAECEALSPLPSLDFHIWFALF
ncbi:centromere protein P isoform X7 [Homo sapiens]|uniref:centromere protein P isoform X7 n=1 Tax=Homo sapiens TaxID=9606 RepID=UPI0023DEAA94|nr:centromere protein P isoform X7 [Homo sapiens]